MIRGALLLACALVALAVLPCPAAAADDKLVVIGGSSATGFFEVLDLVAEQAGFFKDEHLIIDKQYAGSSPVAAQLVAAGKGDIGSFALEPIMTGYDKGIKLVAFYSRDPHYFQVLAVLEGSPIKTLADFKGATIGEYTVGSSAEVAANAELLGAGLKRSDYNYIPIGNGTQAISALTQGKVQGAAFPYPELATYEAYAGLKFRYFWHPILKDIGDDAFVASPATLATKADAIKRFCRAITKAAILIRENPELGARDFVAGSGQKVTPEAIATQAKLLSLSQTMMAGYNPMSMQIGAMPIRDMQVFTKFMYDNGLTQQRVPAAAIVTNQFIQYANDFDHAAFITQAKKMH